MKANWIVNLHHFITNKPYQSRELHKTMFPILNPKGILHKQPDAGYYYLTGEESGTQRINRVGTEILSLCDGKHSINKISTEMAVRYNESPEHAKSLVTPFLAESFQRGTILLKAESDSSSNPNNMTGSFNAWVPLLVSLELTNSCNLTCSHCYASAQLGNGLFPSAEKVIDLIKNLASNGTFSIMLSGGEPTMHPQFETILSVACDHMRLVRVASNLYSVPRKKLDAILLDKKVTVQTSVDGLSSTHNLIRGGHSAYARTLSAVKELSSKGTIVIVAMTANRFNWKQVEEVVVQCKDAGAAAFRLGLTFPNGRAQGTDFCLSLNEVSALQNDWASIVEKYSSADFSLNRSEDATSYEELTNNNNLVTSCGAGYLIAHIKADGTITPCPMLDYPLGNVFTGPLELALSQEKYPVFSNAISPGNENCMGCQFAQLCGSCHAGAKAWGDAEPCWWKSTEISRTLSS